MKILLVLDSYPPDLNGGAYFTHRLAKALMKEGMDVTVAGPSLHFNTTDDQYEGVRIRRFSSFPSMLYSEFRLINPVGIRKRANQLLQNFQPDIVHLQGKFILGNAIFKEAKKMGIPCLATNHLMPQNFEHHFKIPSILLQRFNRIVWKWVFEMFHQLPLILSPTLSGADELRANGLKTPIEVISCGVDNQPFHTHDQRHRVLEFFQIPDAPIVLYTGRLDKEKNVDTIIRACHLALSKLSFHLVLTGTGKEVKKLKALVHSLGLKDHVTFTGKIEDTLFPSIYSVADVFVNACQVELQCISALEALAAGLPVILAHSLALPELVDLENPNGYTFKPGDYNELAQHIHSVLTDHDLKKKLGKNSLLLAKRHDLKNTARQHILTYKRLIHHNKQ